VVTGVRNRRRPSSKAGRPAAGCGPPSRTSSRGGVLLRYVAIARLLTPDQIGLFTFGALALSAVTRFSSIGINPAIIAQDGDLDRQLDAAFTLRIARNLLLTTLLYVGAPVAATVFGDPRAVRLVRLITIVPLVDSVENHATVVFRQELNFRWRAVFQISGVLANAVVAVGLAYYTRSVDALVAGVLAGAAVHTLVSHVIVPRHPVPSLDTAQMRRLLDYGKWLTGNSIVKWLADEGDDALVGAVSAVPVSPSTGAPTSSDRLPSPS
jgi:O-antigen/teichoic acid export membrane protein